MSLSLAKEEQVCWTEKKALVKEEEGEEAVTVKKDEAVILKEEEAFRVKEEDVNVKEDYEEEEDAVFGVKGEEEAMIVTVKEEEGEITVTLEEEEEQTGDLINTRQR
ncbi:neurofilament medium polypeptide-like isoform X2 [Oncorhynchus masou masou]|uniref:neurofilament medium polypeptide-like isoform X2 n=1 Tax=Oncorhynchus masou masou TaxID=90313 RepID=UPI003183309C